MLSVSRRAGPLLEKIGHEDKTRVFAQQGFFDGSEADSLLEQDGIAIFNRIGKGSNRFGLFEMSGDASKTVFVRRDEPLGWFNPANPARVEFSSDGMVPQRGKELVFLQSPEFLLAITVAERSLGEVKLGQPSDFVTESNLIIRANQMMSRSASAQMAKTLYETGHIMGMPRLKAFAEQIVMRQPICADHALRKVSANRLRPTRHDVALLTI